MRQQAEMMQQKKAGKKKKNPLISGKSAKDVIQFG